MRLSPIYIILVTAALVLTSSPQEAAACGCAFDLRTFPIDGSSDVPVNVRLALFTRGEFLPNTSFSLRVAGQRGAIPVLVTSQRRETLRDTLVILDLEEPLAPMTSYELLVGTRVVSTFQTGRQRDDEAPGPMSLRSFSVETMYNEGNVGNSCVESYEGFFGRLRIEYPPLLKDPAYYVLQMRSEEAESWTDDWILLSGPRELDALSIADITCRPRPQILRPGRRYCASVVAVDLAGNVSAPTPELCATAKECELDLSEDGVPVETCREVADSDVNEHGDSGCSVAPGAASGVAYWLLGLLALCWRRKPGKARKKYSELRFTAEYTQR